MKTRQRVIFLGLLLGSLTLLNARKLNCRRTGRFARRRDRGFSRVLRASARPEFIRGVALLHSFFYEEARRSFTAAAEKDPRLCHGAMGHRDDLVASDLDTSDSRRNARGQSGRRQGHGHEWRARIASGDSSRRSMPTTTRRRARPRTRSANLVMGRSARAIG